MREHQGWIEVQSAVDQGSSFHVFLPVCSQRAPSSTRLEEESIRGGNETILLVEDEPDVRLFVGRFLRRCGYDVLEAGDGTEALDVWQAQGVKVKLLYTDMVMPGGMSGLELAERLRTDAPGLKVILSSGYSEELTSQKEIIAARISYIQKPFLPSALATAVRRCLDQPLGSS